MHHRTRYSSVGQDDLHRTPLRGQNQGCVSTTSFSTWWCLTKGYSISTILSRLFSCHGKESCSMHCGSGPMNGGDPCGGIYKYAKIIYKCAGKGSGHAINWCSSIFQQYEFRRHSPQLHRPHLLRLRRRELVLRDQHLRCHLLPRGLREVRGQRRDHAEEQLPGRR